MARNAFSLQFSFLLFAPCYPVRAKRACFPRNGIKDSLEFWIPLRGFRIPDSRYWIPVFILPVRGTWILEPVVSGIPDSLSCIPDSKAQDYEFYKQNFPRFRNRGELPYMGRA